MHKKHKLMYHIRTSR